MLAGLGTVGSGVYETLCRNHALLEARSKIPFRLKRIAVRNLEKPRETVVPRELLTDDWRDLVNDPEIDIIIELIGGTLTCDAGPSGPASPSLREQSSSGFIRAEIFKLSAEMGTTFISENPPAAASPLSRACRISICNHINSIVGIINGTSNYILSAMGEHGADYADALGPGLEAGLRGRRPAWTSMHGTLPIRYSHPGDAGLRDNHFPG